MSTAGNEVTRPGARRGAQLAAVVGVASALVALGVTGAGLLLPAAPPVPLARVMGAVVAIGAGGALVRLDGWARATTMLATVALSGLGVCVLTLPASVVTPPWAAAPDRDTGGGGAPRAESAEAGRDGVIQPSAPGAPSGPGVLALPPGGDVVVEAGRIILTSPAGGHIVIGTTAVAGGGSVIGPHGATVVVVDGVATRDDGGSLGPDVALGGVTIERDDGSRVAVQRGAVLEVPAPLEADAPDPADGLDAILAVLLGCFALLAFAPPVVRLSDRARIAVIVDDEPIDEPPPPPTTIEAGLAGVLRSMLADPDPRTSVIGAYARLLTALAEAGFPRREEEGPHEHLWRCLGPLGVRRQPVHRLAELFVRARFTPHPVTEDHRQAAISALADAVADLRLEASDGREAVAGPGVAPTREPASVGRGAST